MKLSQFMVILQCLQNAVEQALNLKQIFYLLGTYFCNTWTFIVCLEIEEYKHCFMATKNRSVNLGYFYSAHKNLLLSVLHNCLRHHFINLWSTMKTFGHETSHSHLCSHLRLTLHRTQHCNSCSICTQTQSPVLVAKMYQAKMYQMRLIHCNVAAIWQHFVLCSVGLNDTSHEVG